MNNHSFKVFITSSLISTFSLLMFACGETSSTVQPKPSTASPSPTASTTPSTTTPSATPNPSTSTTPVVSGDKVTFATIKAIMDTRCVKCHNPSRAEDGVSLETGDEIKRHVSKIKKTTVDRRSMPEGNETNMTQEERDVLGKWISEGANIQ